jgi:hypothetical protein
MSRQQTDEIKGFMQIFILIYKFNSAEEVNIRIYKIK